MGLEYLFPGQKKVFADWFSGAIEIEMKRYFQEELSVFENVRDDHLALMQWLKKNETLESWAFLLFWMEWLEEEKAVVNPYITNWQD